MIADKLRKSVLEYAIQGKLTVQDSEDGDSKLYKEPLLEERNNFIKQYKLKRSKVDSSNIYNEYQYDLPENWALYKLNDLVCLLGDGLHGTPTYDSNGMFHFINGNNLSDGEIVIKGNTKTVNEETYNKYKKDLNDKTVLVSINGTIGNVAFYNDERVVLGKSACYFNLLSYVEKEYMRYIISTKYFLRYAFENATGTTIKNVSLKTMRNLIVPLPPLAEQKRIVEKLDEFLPMITALENDERKLEVLMNKFPNQIRESVLKSAITGKLTLQYDENSIKHYYPQMSILDSQTENSNDDLPENWSLVKLGNISRIKNGSTPKKSVVDYWNSNDVPWFTVNDIRDQGRIIDKTEQYITYKALGDGKRLIPKNSVLLCCTASLGEYAFTNIDLTTNQQFNGISVLDEYKEHVYPMYLFYWVQTLKKEMYEKAGKTTFPFLSTKKLNEFLVPVPPLEEQKRIVEKLDRLLPMIDQLYK